MFQRLKASQPHMDAIRTKWAESDELLAAREARERELSFAASEGDLAKVQRLLDTGINPTADSNLPIFYAASSGHTEVVKLLINRGAPVEAGSLKIAAENGRLETFRVLIAAAWQVDSAALEKCLCVAAGKGHLEIVRILLERHVDPDADSGAALCNSAANGHAKVVALLFEKNANPDAAYALKSLAQSRGHNNIVDMIIAHRARRARKS